MKYVFEIVKKISPHDLSNTLLRWIKETLLLHSKNYNALRW